MKKKILSYCLIAAIIPTISLAEVKKLPNGEVLYHNTFPLSGSNSYDIFKTNTEYANTVIMSNTIAGVMYGYIIKQKYPNMNFDEDYLYGSLIGQLMQESDMTTQINNKFDPNDPDALINNETYANTLLSPGQGGPYQINDYSKRLPSVGQEGALGLVNYNSVAKVLGYSIAEQDNTQTGQTTKKGPLALDNIYSGPMITAFYHFNDINRMNINSKENWYVYHSEWDSCLKNSQDKSITNRRLSFPFVMNVVYNAGDYSSVLASYLNICSNPSNSNEYENMNNWNLAPADYKKAIGNGQGGDTYFRYPRQVSFYINQILNSNTDKLEKAGVIADNHIVFNTDRLEQVFSMIMHKLSYRDANGKLQYISSQDANSAFKLALTQVSNEDGKIPENLNFSNTATNGNNERLIVYKIITTAISNLSDKGIDFTKTYDETPAPGPTPEPQYTYPDGRGKYIVGTVVTASDNKYQCLVAPWCNSDAKAYNPGTGSASSSAWKNLNPTPKPKPEGTWDPGKTYNEGDSVEIDKIKYKANYWNKDRDPRENNCQYGCEWTIQK